MELEAFRADFTLSQAASVVLASLHSPSAPDSMPLERAMEVCRAALKMRGVECAMLSSASELLAGAGVVGPKATSV